MTLWEDDYILEDGRAWFTVGPYAVRIKLDDDNALSVLVFENGKEIEAPLAQCEVKP
jgi:hypothetical protein